MLDPVRERDDDDPVRDRLRALAVVPRRAALVRRLRVVRLRPPALVRRLPRDLPPLSLPYPIISPNSYPSPIPMPQLDLDRERLPTPLLPRLDDDDARLEERLLVVRPRAISDLHISGANE